MKKRDFLALSAASLFAPRVFAQTAIGGMTLSSISDGNLTLPANMIFSDMDDGVQAQLSADFDLGDTLTPPCNVTLLQTGDRTILFDVGAGQEFMSSTGTLIDTLADLGVSPDDVTDVVFTHAHPDHLWGLVDDFDDLVFQNAQYMMGQAEWDYWTNPETVDTIGDARTTFAVGAARRLERIKEQISFFKDGAEVLPGVAARATFGHTPGHMAFEVRDGTNAMMILGDCIGNHHMAFRHPDIASGSDQDPDMGIATRMALLDQLAADQMPVLGFHLPGNGVGRVERDANAYRFIPEG